jgi:hypothetical protein
VTAKDDNAVEVITTAKDVGKVSTKEDIEDINSASVEDGSDILKLFLGKKKMLVG